MHQEARILGDGGRAVLRFIKVRIEDRYETAGFQAPERIRRQVSHRVRIPVVKGVGK